MEKELAVAAGAGTQTLEQTISTEAKCPVAHGARRAHTNADWWPNQLSLKVLHQNSPSVFSAALTDAHNIVSIEVLDASRRVEEPRKVTVQTEG